MNGRVQLLIPLAAAAALFAGCSSKSDGSDGGTSDSFPGPPTITSVVPQVIVAGGSLYVHGTNLGQMSDSARVTVTLTAVADTADAGVADSGPSDAAAVVPGSKLQATITGLTPTLMTCTVQADVSRVAGRVSLTVTTPAGTVTSSLPLSVISGDNGFGGATAPGTGMIGNVYQLQPNTQMLPNFQNPCADPSVINTPPASPCPFSSILVPNLDVPERSFSDGFPGLQSDLVEWFAIEFSGKLHVTTAGMTAFESCSDDGSIVYIDGQKVVTNDGVHATSCADGMVNLTAGDHAIVVDYFQGPRYEIAVQLYWTPPGAPDKVIIPSSAFSLDVH